MYKSNFFKSQKTQSQTIYSDPSTEYITANTIHIQGRKNRRNQLRTRIILYWDFVDFFFYFVHWNAAESELQLSLGRVPFEICRWSSLVACPLEDLWETASVAVRVMRTAELPQWQCGEGDARHSGEISALILWSHAEVLCGY